jgi:8-oxo-dGTP pyrophosphatase MutT (NUDIX family)
VSNLKPWRVLSSRTLYEDKWVRLRGDECETGDGHILGAYHVLEYRDWSHVVAIDADDHVILVRQYRHGAGIISLELPGGMVDDGETDPAAAAARELMEETGYHAPSIRHVLTLSPNPATHANRMHVSLAEGVTPTGVQNLDGSEAIEIVRVPVAEAVRLAISGGIVQAMHVAALLAGLNAAGRLKGALA